MTGAILLHRFQKMNLIFRGRHSTLDVRCCVYFVNRFVRAVSSGDSVQIARQVWDIMRVSSCAAGTTFGAVRPVWNVILRGMRSIWDALHSTLYTPHCTLYSPRSTYTFQYTPTCTLHT